VYGVIYKITNTINTKVYIGQTVKCIKARFGEHVSHAKNGYRMTAIHRAIRKYGKENFTIEQIDAADSKEELNIKEEYWIKFHKCVSPNGYNLKNGGNNNSLAKESVDKIKKKIRNKLPGRRSIASEFKGVTKVNNKYIAVIRIDRERIIIASSDHGILSAWLYDKYIIENLNREGYLNFPNGPTEEVLKLEREWKMSKLNNTFGINYSKKDNSWMVRVTNAGKTTYIGNRKDKIEAMCLYDSYIIKNGLDKPLNFTYRGF
jgi:group I intron endonuclease